MVPGCDQCVPRDFASACLELVLRHAAANDAEKLEAFRDFWESGEPLIGDEGGLGWLHTMCASSAGAAWRGVTPDVPCMQRS